MIRSQVIKLDPTYKQEKLFRQCTGAARFAYNWALGKWNEEYATGGKPNEARLRKALNAIKKEQFPWMLETPKGVVQQAIKNLGSAYQNFFASVKKKRKGPPISAPVFKSKHKSKQSARLDNGPGTFYFDCKSVHLPKLGKVKTFEELRFEGRALSATISFVGGRWWLSVQVELSKEPMHQEGRPSVGIDLGINTALALSDGKVFHSPKPLKAALEKLARLGRNVSRKVKGSSNRKKAVQRLARQHWKVAQIRKDFQHKATSAIAKQYGLVGLEDLNVKGMLANHKLARSLSDIGFAELRRQLEYKCQKVVVISRWLPTSKTCSRCGHKKKELSLSTRIFNCEACGLELDRDLNAAINIRTASCAEINACGDESSGTSRKTHTKLSSTKQESQLSYLGIQ